MKDLSLEDGTALIQFARKNIESYLQTKKRIEIPPELKQKFSEHAGAFVTLNRYNVSGNPLRGCIGIIQPVYPLIETIHNMSLAAATEDPRFPEVKAKEMDSIVVEISILTIPEVIHVEKPEDYLKEIVIGRDGLIATQGNRRGLLLPQVPVEHDRNWSVEEFLDQTCSKAWLPEDAWKDIKKTKIERFTAIIFEETSPRGPVKRKQIGE
jgi:uncharacterized protein (TIGR00296 family)